MFGILAEKKKLTTPQDILEIWILGLAFAYLVVTTIHQLDSHTKSVLNQETVHTTDRIKGPDTTNPVVLLVQNREVTTSLS